MSWIKRNLFFAIGSLVALILMGLAGWFLYSKWSQNNEVLGTLNSDYEELKRLNSANLCLAERRFPPTPPLGPCTLPTRLTDSSSVSA